jgi:16S rRNA (adenine1518-N6/adenine1519-N6)-dimethyltransferase
LFIAHCSLLIEMNPYLDPTRIKAALNSIDVRPSRDRGQNFLTDAGALAAVVDAAELTPDDTVIEVGPGLGVLTYELVQRAGHVISIELDQRLAARLDMEFGGRANLQIVQSDVLRTRSRELLGGDVPYKVVANLPYQITSAVLRHFLEADPAPDLMVVMVQWEVAKRIVATPPNMSVLAHSVQFYAQPEIVARVPASSFLPSPKVDSAVLRLRRHATPPVDVGDVDAFFRTIKAGFLQARKQLGNALPTGLAGMGVKRPKEAVLDVLRAASIDPMRRAETLTLAEWARVHTLLQQGVST